jgi:DNA-binding NarL/FixJ family response regulator
MRAMSRLESARGPVAAPTRGHGGGHRIRVVIVENHQLVSESLALLLDGQANMEVVGSARTVAEAAAMPTALAPDIAVLDFHLDDGTGRDAALFLRGLFPNVRFVFLSRDGSDRARLAAIEAGASAYLLKSGPASEVIDAVRKVAEGQSLISAAMIARLVSRGSVQEQMRHSLSQRELEVLQMMADGIPTREVSRRLGISYSTVRTHVRSISSKLGTRSMVSAVVTARDLELVS